MLVQRIAGPETGLLGLLSRLRRRRFVYSSASVVDFDFARLRPGAIRLWLFRFGIRLADEIVVQTTEQVELSQPLRAHPGNDQERGGAGRATRTGT